MAPEDDFVLMGWKDLERDLHLVSSRKNKTKQGIREGKRTIRTEKIGKGLTPP